MVIDDSGADFFVVQQKIDRNWCDLNIVDGELRVVPWRDDIKFRDFVVLVELQPTRRNRVVDAASQ